MMELIDFHTHILPGIDDGSASVEESIKMLRMEAQQGIRKVVLTPHFYPWRHKPEEFLQRRSRAYERLQSEAEKDETLPKMVLAAEVHYYKGMSHSEQLPQLAITGTNCILVEMPMPPWSEEMFGELEQFQRNLGLVPIVAHIDRYIRPFRTYGIPAKLERLPVLVQANCSFFMKPFTRHLAKKLLRQGKIHLLGSDCHNTSSRVPCMEDARERMDAAEVSTICAMQTKVFPEEM